MAIGLVYCCLFEFLEAWHLCVQVFKGFFLRPIFTVKELIQTPIKKTAQEKIRRSPTGSWWYKTTFHRWQKLSNTLWREEIRAPNVCCVSAITWWQRGLARHHRGQALQAHTAQVQAVLCSRNGTFVLHCKKRLAIFPSPALISLTKQLSLAMEEFV
jgi:hypothetical protein